MLHGRICRHIRLLAVGFAVCTGSASAQDAVPLDPEPLRFVIEIPEVVLTGVPVDTIRIVAQDLAGLPDTSFTGRPLIQGVVIRERGEELALPPFENGVLELNTDLAADRRVYVTDGQIVVDPESRRPGLLEVPRIPGWLSLLPPLLAIGLAIWFRNVIVALFAGVWCGSIILAHGNFFAGLLRSLDTHLLRQLVQPNSGTGAYHPSNHDHMLIILFTLFLGAMVGVMVGSGGTGAMVKSLARFTKTREHCQVITWLLGLFVFFDDYANTLLIGSTMRPVTDRLKISREKLAFLVDSTAAPVAGLALVSTWVGVEIGYIGDAYKGLAATYTDLNLQFDAYEIFLRTLPYRFYPLWLLVFVFLIAYSGHDFGAMYRAEARALHKGQTQRPGTLGPKVDLNRAEAVAGNRELLRNALIPLAVLLTLTVVGLWWTGSTGLNRINESLQKDGEPALPVTLWSIMKESQSSQVLFLSSFFASAVGIISAVAFRSLNLQRAIEAWLEGATSMFPAVVVLVFAWGIAMICDERHLNTAGYLVEWTNGILSARWMPSLAFVLAAGVSFATGSSWATMSLLIPLCISLTFQLLVPLNEADPQHHLLLATIGAVLAGAIFGDHCSPISDTTVLSAAAAGCDHLDHVTTQLPYALVVGVVSLLFGYIPVGFGYSPMVLMPIALVFLYVVVEFYGSSAAEAEVTQSKADAPVLPPLPDGDSDLPIPDDILKNLPVDE